MTASRAPQVVILLSLSCRYVRSLNSDQLGGNYKPPQELGSCAPQQYAKDNTDGTPVPPNSAINPCGLMAYSYFNDSFSLQGFTLDVSVSVQCTAPDRVQAAGKVTLWKRVCLCNAQLLTECKRHNQPAWSCKHQRSHTASSCNLLSLSIALFLQWFHPALANSNDMPISIASHSSRIGLALPCAIVRLIMVADHQLRCALATVQDSNIAWSTDRNDLYGDYAPSFFNVVPRSRGGGQIQGNVSDDQHFLVWMRPGAARTVRKLYAQINEDIPAGDFDRQQACRVVYLYLCRSCTLFVVQSCFLYHA